MSSTVFDIAIIGAGAAGLHLALAMHRDPSFLHKKMLILEKDNKDQNDRTWCFWEKGAGNWDNLLRKSWEHGDFYCQGDALQLDLMPYRYKMLRGLDFYTFAKHELAASPQFTWQKEEVVSVKNGEPIQIAGQNGRYEAAYLFDSRIPEDFFQQNKYTNLPQHFKGWVVRTPEDCFDPSRFNMMDYRLQWKDTTSFTYLLPLSRREALVEFTLFSPDLLADGDYDLMLGRYMNEILKINQFDIIETEQGIIPMSDFPFEKYSEGNHIRIGTAGGWVKPSSGYSFKNCERNAKRIVENLNAGRQANKGIISPRFRHYDSIFLDVINRRNDLGASLFQTMFLKNDIQKIFAFLDEESTIGDDLRMMSGFPQLLFLRSLLQYIAR